MGYFYGLERTKPPIFEPKIAFLRIDRSADLARYWVAGPSASFGAGGAASACRGGAPEVGGVSGMADMLPEPPKRPLRASRGEIPGTRDRGERGGRARRRSRFQRLWPLMNTNFQIQEMEKLCSR